jgi:DNA-3-methyladenine glycosylase I
MQKKRCFWVGVNKPHYEKYHDEEWGRPVHEDRKHFEMLILEGAQAGLSWETILLRREGYRKAFANFDPVKVSQFTPARLKKLQQDVGIIRNRLKIQAAVTNAKSFLQVQEEFGTFDKYIWQFVNNKPIVNYPKKREDMRATSEISDALSADLKKRGFKFVGSTIIYAHMQAIGMVDDHMVDCWCKKTAPSKKSAMSRGVKKLTNKKPQAHQSVPTIQKQTPRSKSSPL